MGTHPKVKYRCRTSWRRSIKVSRPARTTTRYLIALHPSTFASICRKTPCSHSTVPVMLASAHAFPKANVPRSCPSLVQVIHRIFERIDYKKDNKIDKEELEHTLRSLGYEPVRVNQYGISEVEQMIWEVDEDCDGCVSLEEFQQMFDPAATTRLETSRENSSTSVNSWCSIGTATDRFQRRNAWK